MISFRPTRDWAGYGKPKDDSQFVHQVGKGETKIIIDLRSPEERGDLKVIEGVRLSDTDPLSKAGDQLLAISRPIRGSEI